MRRIFFFVLCLVGLCLSLYGQSREEIIRDNLADLEEKVQELVLYLGKNTTPEAWEELILLIEEGDEKKIRKFAELLLSRLPTIKRLQFKERDERGGLEAVLAAQARERAETQNTSQKPKKEILIPETAKELKSQNPVVVPQKPRAELSSSEEALIKQRRLEEKNGFKVDTSKVNIKTKKEESSSSPETINTAGVKYVPGKKLETVATGEVGSQSESKSDTRSQFIDGRLAVYNPETNTWLVSSRQGSLATPQTFSYETGDTVALIMRAIGEFESGMRYAAKNKYGAHGAYQVMWFNVPEWSKHVLGYNLSVEKFRKSPKLQDQIVYHRMTIYYGELSSSCSLEEKVRHVASRWFTGQPYSKKTAGKKDSFHTSNRVYVAKVWKNFKRLAAEQSLCQK